MRKLLFISVLLSFSIMSRFSILFASNVTNNVTNTEKKEIVIALVPERNVFQQKRIYQVLTDYLSKKMNYFIRLNIQSDYSAICSKFRMKDIDAAFVGSLSYIVSHHKAGIVPLVRPVWADGSSTYTGYLLVRKSSLIKNIEDMKGKRLVLVDMETTAGYIYPLFYFKTHGINNISNYFSKVFFAGSHDAAVWSLHTGEADVAFAKNHIVNEMMRRFPELNDEISILSESFAVPSNALVVRADMDTVLKKKLMTALLELDKTPEGRKVLKSFGAKRFIKTEDSDYKNLYEMIKKVGIDISIYPCSQ